MPASVSGVKSAVCLCLPDPPAIRSGGSVPVLRPVHHNVAVRPDLQLHPDGDAAGERGEDGGVLDGPPQRAAGPEHAGLTGQVILTDLERGLNRGCYGEGEFFFFFTRVSH